MKTWTDGELAELSNLYYLARTALAGQRSPYGTTADCSYQRKLWAAQAYSEKHPEVSSTAAYKALCRGEAWRY